MNFGKRRRANYNYLIDNHFNNTEARELSVLPRNGNYALADMVRMRNRQWDRFVERARRKVDNGKWRKADTPKKWNQYLKHWYNYHNYVAGALKKARIRKRLVSVRPISPWEWYRNMEKQSPEKKYVSPWEVRLISKPAKLNLSALAKSRVKNSGRVAPSTIHAWIDQLQQRIKSTGTESEKRQWRDQQVKLARMLGEGEGVQW